jgi:Raf kinase inhibitor-like YbhB/YbcL family protein
MPSAGLPKASPEVAKLTVTSGAFTDGQPIPRRYTCDGADRSPPLSWTGVPAAARSLVLIVEDPDAPGGTWVHWVVEMGAARRDFSEAVMQGGDVKFVVNDFGKPRYGGPCPPSGSAHRYNHRLYALDQSLHLSTRAPADDGALPPGSRRALIDRLLKGHVLAEGQLMGRYARVR